MKAAAGGTELPPEGTEPPELNDPGSAQSPAAPTVEPPLGIAHKRSVVYCAACFFVLFTAYSPSQSYVTTIHTSFGSYSIILIYTFLGLFGLLAPPIINRLGVRTSFLVSSLTYGLWILSVSIYSSSVPLGFASCLLGAGGGVLWVNQVCFQVASTYFVSSLFSLGVVRVCSLKPSPAMPVGTSVT
jgi:hypothetical protein